MECGLKLDFISIIQKSKKGTLSTTKSKNNIYYIYVFLSAVKLMLSIVKALLNFANFSAKLYGKKENKPDRIKLTDF